MLTITEGAAVAIRTILESTEFGQNAGIRICAGTNSANGNGPGLELQLAEVPAADDAVVEELGAQVFLDETAQIALEDKALDAQVAGGDIRFEIVDEEV